MNKSSNLMQVYLSRRANLERFLAARLGNREDAQDVLQELCLRLDRSRAPEEIQDTAAYLFRMAANLASDYRRAKRRSEAREATWVATRHAGSTVAISDAPSAEASYAAKQRLEAVRRVLDELSPQCRRVFILHKFDGLSHGEITERIGISRSTVEKHMHNALAHLIRRLGRD